MPQEAKIRKEELLAKLTENRANHQAKFAKAFAAYRLRAIDELERALTDAVQNSDIRLFISLIVPEDHTEDYDREITMLKMEIHDEITLNSREFDQFVMDRWGWSDSASRSYAAYNVS